MWHAVTWAKRGCWKQSLTAFAGRNCQCRCLKSLYQRLVGSPFNLSISSDYRSNKRISFEHQRSLKFSCDHEQPTASSLEQQLGTSTNGYVAILQRAASASDVFCEVHFHPGSLVLEGLMEARGSPWNLMAYCRYPIELAIWRAIWYAPFLLFILEVSSNGVPQNG